MFSFHFFILFSLRIYYFVVLCFWGLRPKSILAQSRPINYCSAKPCTAHLVGHKCDPNFGAQTAYPGPDPRETQLALTRPVPGLILPRLSSHDRQSACPGHAPAVQPAWTPPACPWLSSSPNRTSLLFSFLSLAFSTTIVSVDFCPCVWFYAKWGKEECTVVLQSNAVVKIL